MRVKQHDATLALEAASCIVMQGLPKPAGNCSQCDATRSAHPCPPPTCRRARLQHHRRLSCHRLLLVALGGRQRVLLPNGAETAGRRWVERVITGWGWSPVWRELRIYWRTKARQRGKQHSWRVQNTARPDCHGQRFTKADRPPAFECTASSALTLPSAALRWLCRPGAPPAPPAAPSKQRS